MKIINYSLFIIAFICFHLKGMDNTFFMLQVKGGTNGDKSKIFTGVSNDNSSKIKGLTVLLVGKYFPVTSPTREYPNAHLEYYNVLNYLTEARKQWEQGTSVTCCLNCNSKGAGKSVTIIEHSNNNPQASDKKYTHMINPSGHGLRK